MIQQLYPLGKKPLTLLEEKGGGPQDLVLMLWREEKFLLPTWNRTTIIFLNQCRYVPAF